MHPAGLHEHQAAGAGEHGVLAAGVLRAGPALNQPSFHQSIDEPRNTARREQHEIGELGHRDALFGMLIEVEQHLVLADVQLVLGVEL